MPDTLPLFPLGTVLFPEGVLKLRIFEARYLAMVSRSLRENSGFGVALIVEGREAGGPARTAATGTAAQIVDFEQLPDGLLGITVRGERRFRISGVEYRPDGLSVASVTWLDEEPVVPMPEQLAMLAELMKQAQAQAGTAYAPMAPRYQDAGWVGMRLAEILPLTLTQRQQCLEMDDALERLQFLRERLDIRQH